MSKSKSNGHGSRKSNKTKHILLGIIIAVLTVSIIALGCVFAAGERFYNTHFVKGTVINDIDVSGMTIDELNDRIRTYQLTVIERTSEGEQKKETISADEVGLQLSSTDELKKILAGQKKGKWLTLVGKKYDVENFVDYDSKAWKECMNYIKCFSKDFVVEPTDAYVADYDTDKKSFEIVKETMGNAVDRDQVEEILSDALRQLEPKVDLEELDCYKKPEIYGDDPELTTLVKNLNHYVNITITYNFGDTKEIVDGDLIKDWVKAEKDNSMTLEKDKVNEYVASLRKKYDTIFRPRKFMTSYGKEVTLSDGDYGWWMNTNKEQSELAAMIEAGESGERTPVYIQTAAKYGEKDYGDTYVEVNLTAQHMFYYEDGQLVLESDFVSGNSSKGHSTGQGVFGVTYKQRNATLVGEDYETPVSYWMPFNGHQGLHDATWRDKFGSNLYKTGGSHGCVNLPYKVAKELYSKISQGTPVICYHLRGTESDEITPQTSQEIAQAAIDRIDEIGNVTKDSEKVIARARVVYNELKADQRELVSNYHKLTAAEKKFKEITGREPEIKK